MSDTRSAPQLLWRVVYNINKGYAVFKRIEKLSGNGEYFTIAKGTDYGLSVYDHIVLDAPWLMRA